MTNSAESSVRGLLRTTGCFSARRAISGNCSGLTPTSPKVVGSPSELTNSRTAFAAASPGLPSASAIAAWCLPLTR